MRDGPQSPVKYINSATQQLDALRARLDNSPVGDITCADVESIELTDDMETRMKTVVANAGRLWCQILRPRDECAARHAVERVSIRLDSAKPRVVMGSWNLRFYSKYHSMGKMKVKAEHVVKLLSCDNVHVSGRRTRRRATARSPRARGRPDTRRRRRRRRRARRRRRPRRRSRRRRPRRRSRRAPTPRASRASPPRRVAPPRRAPSGGGGVFGGASSPKSENPGDGGTGDGALCGAGRISRPADPLARRWT